jgi:hypothetical protein
MKLKKVLNTVLGHHMMRHRQHKRFINNALSHVRSFGPGRGLLFLGVIALAGRFLQKRHAAHNAAQLTEMGSSY